MATFGVGVLLVYEYSGTEGSEPWSFVKYSVEEDLPLEQIKRRISGSKEFIFLIIVKLIK